MAAPEGSQFDAKMTELLRADGEEFFTSYDEVYDSFDAMGLQENLLRGIYAYAVFREDQHILSSGVHVIVGTPGRVFNMLRRQSLHPDYIKMFVLDEADEMLSRGFKDQVDDKYQYMCENKDNKVHGWICLDPPVGFWQITPSNEFRMGGPLKPDQFA